METIMNHTHEASHKEFASNSKGNAGLTLGIIGTALGALNTIGTGRGLLGGILGGGPAPVWGGDMGAEAAAITPEDLYIERKQCRDYIDTTKQFYEGQIVLLNKIDKGFEAAKQQNIDWSFGLYKYSRDSKDELAAKIAEVNAKVDVMAAVRPYQDALINAKIDNNALVADFNLFRRTCKMMTGQLVLPSTPTVTGYGSYLYCCGNQPVSETTNG
jgi:hypothetical protein